jgi:hypothetical protein
MVVKRSISVHRSSRSKTHKLTVFSLPNGDGGKLLKTSSPSCARIMIQGQLLVETWGQGAGGPLLLEIVKDLHPAEEPRRKRGMVLVKQNVTIHFQPCLLHMSNTIVTGSC